MLNRNLVSALTIVFLAATLSPAATATKIEFPLVATEVKEHDLIEVPLASLNEELKLRHLPGFPETAVFGKKDKPWAEKLKKRTVDAAQALHRDLHLYAYGTSGLYLHEVPTPFCYRGKPSDVPGIVQALMGTVFHPDQGIQAVRYGKVKKVMPDFRKDFFDTVQSVREEDEENNPNEVAAWDGYDEDSDSVLIMSDLGPEGDGVELYATRIPRCE